MKCIYKYKYIYIFLNKLFYLNIFFALNTKYLFINSVKTFPYVIKIYFV